MVADHLGPGFSRVLFVEDVGVEINNNNPGITPTKFIGVNLSEKGKSPVVYPEH